jgi:hypothetical protein
MWRACQSVAWLCRPVAAQGLTLTPARQPEPATQAGTDALREQLAGVIDAVYAVDDAARRAAALASIWQVVRCDYDAEAERIKTGMYA